VSVLAEGGLTGSVSLVMSALFETSLLGSGVIWANDVTAIPAANKGSAMRLMASMLIKERRFTNRRLFWFGGFKPPLLGLGERFRA
jgi:hypothetical protein